MSTTEQSFAYRLAVLGAISTLFGILLSGPVTLAVIVLIGPQQMTDDAQVIVNNYLPVHAAPYYFGFFLVGGYLVMMTALYYLAYSWHKPAALVAVIFTAIFATLIFFNYVNQTTFVPDLVRHYRPEYAPLVATLSMANPHSLAWALEMWGYGVLGLATWFAAPIFGGSRLEEWTRRLFILNGVASVAALVPTVIDPGWLFTVTGLASYALWNVLVFVMSACVVVALRRRQRAAALPAAGPAPAVARQAREGGLRGERT